MTKKDYIELAKRIKIELDNEPNQQKRDGIWIMIKTLTDFLKYNNSRFDVERFLNAIQ